MHRLIVLAIALAIGLAPSLTVAHSAQAAPARWSIDQARPLAVSASRPQREVFGFVNAGSLGGSNGYASWDMSLLTTVAFFGLHVNSGDGQPVTINDTAWNVFHSATMTNFVNAAHANGVRVIVSLNMHDFSADQTQMCQSLADANIPTTVDWAIREMNSAHIDGINVNYEGIIKACAPGVTNRDQLTKLVKTFRTAMPGKYLAIDTYAGSAEDNLEFFDITGLAPYVDAFFVMSYDSDSDNAVLPPINCTSYCMNPVSPLKAYRFNVTLSVNQYIALVAPSKVILGQPLYGRAACVDSASVAHQIPRSHFTSPTYLWASRLIYQPGVSNAAGHRDPEDGVSEWDTWWDADWGCIAEQYYDDVQSLSAKYDLVNRTRIGGVGFFTLDYGGGSPELWAALSTYFSCPVSINLPATSTTTGLSVGLSAGSCSVAYFDVEQSDTTLNQGWFALRSVAASGGSGTALTDGFAGHNYQFRARAHSKAGVVSSWAYATTQVSTTATRSHPWSGLYTLDGYGGVSLNDSPPLGTSAYWAGWSIARTARALPGANAPQAGFVLDGFGGLHQYGSPVINETLGAGGHYWGWNIARDFAFMPDGTGGFVLDGFGGLHPFKVNGSTTPLQAQGNSYWGWDIARKVVIFPDGTGGYTLDGWGGIHPFGINGAAPVSTIASNTYWPGWDIAHDIVLVPGNGNRSGYVLDGYGGLHPFHPTGDGSASPAAISSVYWGWDIGRAVWFLPGSATAGYVLDGWGGLNTFGGAPAITNSSYWKGFDIARATWGA